MTSINITGILLDRDGLGPIPGVKVLETNSSRQEITDANGFYSMQVSVDGAKPRLMLKFVRDGYLTHSSGLGFLPTDIPPARILIDVLYPVSMGLNEDYLHSIPQNSPPEPDYADTVAAMEKVRADHRVTIRFREMWKAHPEISLFYITKDSHRRLVLYRDGRVEGYGGPGEPDFATMDARYAPLPWYMTQISKEPAKRPSAWQKISQRVQKDFQPTRGNAKAIVFPGDSQIIVIPSEGEPEMYEMVDAGSPRGRSEFEARFGPLPDYIPVAEKQGDNYLVRLQETDTTGSVEIRSISKAKR